MAKANVAEIKIWLTLFLTNLKPNTQMKEKTLLIKILETLPVSANIWHNVPRPLYSEPY